MKKIEKLFIAIILIFILLVELVVPLYSHASDTNIGDDGLIRLNIKGTDRTVTKTTTIEEIKQWYAGEHIFETPSLFGGSAFSFYVGDKFDDYLYIETIADGTIFSYGSVDPSYKTNTYSFGDDYPYNDRYALHGCFIPDNSKIVGGVYYNKSVYLNGKSADIIAAYRENFEKAYAEANQIEVSEIGTEKDKKRQPKIILDMSKHATIMFNGIMEQYGNVNGFIQTDRDESGNDTFKSVENYFETNNQFMEFSTNICEYVVNMDVQSLRYKLLGFVNCDIAYSAYYLFNPSIMAGQAVNCKKADLRKCNIPVWTYKYSPDKKQLVGGVFSNDLFKRDKEIELNDAEKSRLEQGKEYYNKAIEKFGDLNSTDIYKTLPNYETAENIYEGELKDNIIDGITAYYNSIRVANGYEPVTKDEQGISIAQHMTTLLSYIRKWIKPSP